MIFRPATREDLETFHGELFNESCRLWAAVKEPDQVVALGGWYLIANKAMVITKVDKEKTTKRERVQAARFLMDKVRRLPFEILAECTQGSEQALAHFGFVGAGHFWRLVR